MFDGLLVSIRKPGSLRLTAITKMSANTRSRLNPNPALRTLLCPRRRSLRPCRYGGPAEPGPGGRQRTGTIVRQQVDACRVEPYGRGVSVRCRPERRRYSAGMVEHRSASTQTMVA